MNEEVKGIFKLQLLQISKVYEDKKITMFMALEALFSNSNFFPLQFVVESECVSVPVNSCKFLHLLCKLWLSISQFHNIFLIPLFLHTIQGAYSTLFLVI